MSMPPFEPGSPSYAKDKAAIWKAINEIWRELKRPQPANQPTETIFSFAGKPVADQSSPPYSARMSANINRIMVTLGVAGETPSVVKVYLNGEEISTVTVWANEQSAFDLPDADMNDGDFLTVAVTVPGINAADFTIQAFW
jgi:HSP20 family molecular chaperone IbpA